MGESIHEQVRSHWRSQVEKYGVISQRPGVKDEKELHEALRSMGAEVTQVEVVRFPRSYVVRELIERIAKRSFSHSWDVPDDVLEKSLDELKSWSLQEYGDLDTVFEEQACFILDITHF